MCTDHPLTAGEITRAQMVIIQLSRFRNVQYGLVMPFGTTQDGIGLAIGSSRAHVSILVKQLIGQG